MEIEVFNKARDGKLSELKNILDHLPDDEVVALASAVTDGITPLIVACKNGHLDVAIYLLEKCHVDVEQDGYKGYWERGTPVYWAAANGHLNLVKTLITQYNASVEGAVGRSSPLRGACVSGNLEIGKYLIEHHSVDIESCYAGEMSCMMATCFSGHYEFAEYLLECGADVHKKSGCGATALHVSVRSDSLEIIKLLFAYGATLSTDRDGFTPLLTAAECGSIDIVEYFIQECNCTKQEKVDALELLGAALAAEWDMMEARNFWRQALELRYEDNAFPLEKPKEDSALSSYINVKEWRSIEQLGGLTDDEMEVQALLVRVRIIGPYHYISAQYIEESAEICDENGNFQRAIRLWMYIIDSKQLTEDDIDIPVINFTKVFYKMIYKTWDDGRNMPDIFCHDVLHILERAVLAIKKSLSGCPNNDMDLSENKNFCEDLVIALHLVNIMCMLEPFLNAVERRSFKKAVYDFVTMKPKGSNGFSLLHIACFKDPSPIPQLPDSVFPSQSVVNALLEVGAVPNAVDSSNNTPLHIAAMNRPFDASIFYSLLNQGAHIDLPNKENQTPLQFVPEPFLVDINPLQHLNLQCLCAQAIHKHKISHKGHVPKNLFEFVESHGSN